MRRRRLPLTLRAMVMAAPSFIPTCASQAPAPEATRTAPPVIEGPEAAHRAGQPVSGAVADGKRTHAGGRRAAPIRDGAR